MVSIIGLINKIMVAIPATHCKDTAFLKIHV